MKIFFFIVLYFAFLFGVLTIVLYYPFLFDVLTEATLFAFVPKRSFKSNN